MRTRTAIQPRQNAAARTAASSPLERKHECLRSELVREIASGTSMEIPVDRAEVALEDQLERNRLAQRARHALRVRQNRLHHPDCARSLPLGFKGAATVGSTRTRRGTLPKAGPGRRHVA